MAESILLLADMRKCIKDTFGDVITNLDPKIPRYDAAEAKYEEAKQNLRDQVKRIYAGLEKWDNADDPDRREKIASRMTDIAQNEVGEAFGLLVRTFTDLIEEYQE